MDKKIEHTVPPLSIPLRIEQGVPKRKMKVGKVSSHVICALTGQEVPCVVAIKLVASPEGEIVADLYENLPLPGIWVEATRSLLEQTTQDFAILLRGSKQGTLPSKVIDNIEQGLYRSCIEALALAHKAGIVTQGYEKVLKLAQKNAIYYYIRASDSTAAPLVKREHAQNSTVFTRSQLSKLFGKEEVVHVALKAHPLALVAQQRIHRLQNWLGKA